MATFEPDYCKTYWCSTFLRCQDFCWLPNTVHVFVFNFLSILWVCVHVLCVQGSAVAVSVQGDGGRRYDDGQWHSIIATRRGAVGTIVVNNQYRGNASHIPTDHCVHEICVWVLGVNTSVVMFVCTCADVHVPGVRLTSVCVHVCFYCMYVNPPALHGGISRLILFYVWWEKHSFTHRLIYVFQLFFNVSLIYFLSFWENQDRKCTSVNLLSFSLSLLLCLFLLVPIYPLSLTIE